MYKELIEIDLSNLKFKPYSHSKISTHQQCPAKFKFKYIDKIQEPQIPQIHFDKGTFIHLLLEHNGDLNKVKASPDFKEVYSHGLITPAQYKEYFKMYKTFIDSTAGKSILKRKEIMKEFAIGLTPDLEMTKYDAPDAILRGYIDAAYVDEKSDTLILIDWKTGKLPRDVSFQQLMFYAISLFSKMPFDRILIMYAYIEHCKVEKTMLKREDLPKYKKALNQLIGQIELDTVFPKNETALCNWCSYQDHCLGTKDQEVPWDV